MFPQRNAPGRNTADKIQSILTVIIVGMLFTLLFALTYGMLIV